VSFGASARSGAERRPAALPERAVQRRGKVGQAQGKANVKCLKARQVLATGQARQSDQERTTDACLTNDPKGAVAKKVDGSRRRV